MHRFSSRYSSKLQRLLHPPNPKYFHAHNYTDPLRTTLTTSLCITSNNIYYSFSAPKLKMRSCLAAYRWLLLPLVVRASTQSHLDNSTQVTLAGESQPCGYASKQGAVCGDGLCCSLAVSFLPIMVKYPLFFPSASSLTLSTADQPVWLEQ